MKTLGIIVEYNPFHIGHRNHLALSKEITGCQTVVAVMSGNFVQRGEPAVCDKWRRTKMALKAGVDLVVELPVCYATASAGYFAKGACTLLDRLGFVDCICFGSECDDITALEKYAEILLEESGEFKERLQIYLRQGLSYPAARAKAAETDLPDAPNNVLGVEYIKALKELDSGIVPYTVPRYPVSAKDIRADLSASQRNMPSFAWEILEESINLYGPAKLDNLSPILHYILRTGNFSGLSEDLKNRLTKCAENHKLISEILASVKTKRYTYLHLQRAVLHTVLGGLNPGQEPQYIRVLGFRKDSKHLLKLLEEKASLPVILNKKPQMLQQEINSTKLYSLAFPKHVNFNEYTMPLVIV